MPSQQPKTPGDATLWIVVCTLCDCAGWLLSVCGQLNAGGYVVLMLIAVTGFFLIRSRLPAFNFSAWNIRKLRRRARRLFPLGYFVLAGMSILGGLLYAPSNYDALAYRTPRVLHWLAEDHWHWIHTDFARLNVRTCGMEWVTAPLLALTRSDRSLFLISAISFLLLPGRVFSLLTRLGVRGRVAWYWMWLLPTGYCYLLQAGSIGNDLFGAILAMLAIEFALRAAQTQRREEAYVSVLAAALMTAGKAFNLLLLLPWGLAMLPALRALWRRPWELAPLALAAGGASLLPTAVLNFLHCGDWTGLRAEQVTNLANGDRAFHVLVNGIQLALHNLTPPVFPLASAWNHLMDRTIPAAWSERLERNFEPYAAHFHVGELEMEEHAGLGFCVSLLLLAWVVHRLLAQRRHPERGWVRALAGPAGLVPLGALLAVGVFMSQSGLSGPTRYLAPFYVLLVAPLLAGVPASKTLIHTRWWRASGMGVFIAGALLLILSPARPLWPAQTVLGMLGDEQSRHGLVLRAWTVYSVYGHRGDAFEAAKAVLPPDANPLGLVTSDDPETSLWRPFGRRRILHVCQADSPAVTRAQGIRYALVNSVVVESYNISFDEWLVQHDAELVQRLSLGLRAGSGPRDWFLVRFR